jgi:hypothetical protein
MLHYGVYTQWDETSKQLPKLVEVTTDIPARENIEFGFVVKFKKAKGLKFNYTIYHPDIPDEYNNILPPFTGELYVKNNDWDFYLGDTLWQPLNNKLGHWRMALEHNGSILAEKTFIVDIEIKGERTLGAARSSFKPRKR